jgi:hypothetical protein
LGRYWVQDKGPESDDRAPPGRSDWRRAMRSAPARAGDRAIPCRFSRKAPPSPRNPCRQGDKGGRGRGAPMSTPASAHAQHIHLRRSTRGHATRRHRPHHWQDDQRVRVASIHTGHLVEPSIRSVSVITDPTCPPWPDGSSGGRRCPYGERRTRQLAVHVAPGSATGLGDFSVARGHAEPRSRGPVSCATSQRRWPIGGPLETVSRAWTPHQVRAPFTSGARQAAALQEPESLLATGAGGGAACRTARCGVVDEPVVDDRPQCTVGRASPRAAR